MTQPVNKRGQIPFVQGQADGLCGLYGIINFLALNDSDYGKNYSGHDLWHLLIICQEFGWLTPQSMHQGFEDYQLKRVFNQHCENRKLGFQAFFLMDYMAEHDFGSVARVAESLSESNINRPQNCGLLVYLQKRDHWILVNRENAMPKIYDSQSNEAQIFHPNLLPDACPYRGLVILPKDRQLSRIFS